MNKGPVFLTALIEALGAISRGEVKPYFTIPEYATQALIKAKEQVNAKPVVHLDTDAEDVSKDFYIARNFVKNFAKKVSDITLEEVTQYPSKDGKKYALYKVTLLPNAATAEAVDWLDSRTDTYSSDAEGAHIYFSIGLMRGIETAYLTEETNI